MKVQHKQPGIFKHRKPLVEIIGMRKGPKSALQEVEVRLAKGKVVILRILIDNKPITAKRLKLSELHVHPA